MGYADSTMIETETVAVPQFYCSLHNFKVCDEYRYILCDVKMTTSTMVVETGRKRKKWN